VLFDSGREVAVGVGHGGSLGGLSESGIPRADAGFRG
jgi:hypothetical protein